MSPLVCGDNYNSIVLLKWYVSVRQVATLEPTAFHLFGTLGIVSLSVNPFIYAARYEVFQRYLKKKLFKIESATHSTSMQSTSAQRAQRQDV